jgi:hypothetical protein
MRWAAVVALALAAACSSNPSEASAPTSRPTTTKALTPDEAYLEDLHGQVDFNNPEWGDQAIDLAKSTCELLDAGQAAAESDAPNDSPRSDAMVSDYVTDAGLTIIYDQAGEDLDATAAVLVLGAQHFCPEHKLAVEGDAAARGLRVTPSA